MKESKLLRGVVATTFVLAFATPVFASADTGLGGRMYKVEYSDLNVDRKAGAEILYRRLQEASKKVCGVESIRTVRGARIEAEQRECFQQTLDQAVADVDSEALDAIHEG